MEYLFQYISDSFPLATPYNLKHNKCYGQVGASLHVSKRVYVEVLATAMSVKT